MVGLFMHKEPLSTSETRKLGGYCFGGQVDRMTSKPLTTDDAKLTKFGSLKGRAYCLLNIFVVPLREGFREGINLLVVAEKIVTFVRVFFEKLSGKEGLTWRECGDRMKDVLTSISALPARVVTVVFDEFKLAAGILYPAAAIKGPEKNEDEISKEDLEREFEIGNEREFENIPVNPLKREPEEQFESYEG